MRSLSASWSIKIKHDIRRRRVRHACWIANSAGYVYHNLKRKMNFFAQVISDCGNKITSVPTDDFPGPEAPAPEVVGPWF